MRNSLHNKQECVFLIMLFLSAFPLQVFSGQSGKNRFNVLTILTKSTDEQKVVWEHGAVMRSLLTGLTKIGAPFNYNPSNVNDIGDVVVVPCGTAAVSEAINLKRHGRVKKLIVGPNFYPHDVNFPEVDIYIVPSAPVIQFVQAVCPELAARCRVSYAGIDHEYWQQPTTHVSSKNVLVYWKTESEQFCKDAESMLMRYGWQPRRMHYGSYTPQQYKELLADCCFAVFISRSESQGLALAEAWSMNIPTLCWNPMNATVLGHTYTFLPSCPYLNGQVGREWKTINDFELLLQSIEKLLPTFTPRAWVLDHMTDEIAAQLLVNLINESFEYE